MTHCKTHFSVKNIEDMIMNFQVIYIGLIQDLEIEKVQVKFTLKTVKSIL